MADEFVSTAQFGEFVKRIDECFVDVNKLADQRYENLKQRLADAEKAREQNLVHINQRFDDMNRSMSQRFDDMWRGVNQRFDDMKEGVNHRFDSLEKMLAWQNRVSMGIFLLILAAVFKYLFFPG